MKSECSNDLTRLFGDAASHRRLQVTNNANLLMFMRLLTRTMKKTDDDESDFNRNELMTTMMRTKRMMRMMKMMRMIKMMRMMGTIRMVRMLRLRMRMKMTMMIMMRRSVVGLQYLLGPASENPPMQVSSLAGPAKFFKQKKRKINKISFGGVPNSRNVVFLQIFLCVLRRQALEPSPEPVEPDLALHQGFLEPSPGNPVEPDLALHQSFPHLLRNLLRNPAQPDLALHQSLPDLLGTFSGTLLNLTWLCTKSSQTFSGTFS